TMQCTVGEPDSALNTLNTCLSLYPDLLTVRMGKAMFLERMNKNNEAMVEYKDLLNRYSKLAIKYPDSIYIRANKAMAIMFVKGELAGRKEYDAVCKQFPGNKKVESARSFFYDFDRKKFIKSICE